MCGGTGPFKHNLHHKAEASFWAHYIKLVRIWWIKEPTEFRYLGDALDLLVYWAHVAIRGPAIRDLRMD